MFWTHISFKLCLKPESPASRLRARVSRRSCSGDSSLRSPQHTLWRLIFLRGGDAVDDLPMFRGRKARGPGPGLTPLGITDDSLLLPGDTQASLREKIRTLSKQRHEDDLEEQKIADEYAAFDAKESGVQEEKVDEAPYERFKRLFPALSTPSKQHSQEITKGARRYNTTNISRMCRPQT